MLILASRSAVRKTLLEQAGLAFAVEIADVNEREIESQVTGGPAAIARRLAEAKATAIGKGVAIGADQVLALDSEILHKAADMAEARGRLTQLRGKTHQLHGGVALARDGRLVWSEVVTSTLTMRDFSDTERERVLALEGEAVLGSVGAYRFEGPSVQLFDKIEGDYFSILGLPLLPLLAALRVHAPEVFS